MRALLLSALLVAGPAIAQGCDREADLLPALACDEQLYPDDDISRSPSASSDEEPSRWTEAAATLSTSDLASAAAAPVERPSTAEGPSVGADEPGDTARLADPALGSEPAPAIDYERITIRGPISVPAPFGLNNVEHRWNERAGWKAATITYVVGSLVDTHSTWWAMGRGSHEQGWAGMLKSASREDVLFWSTLSGAAFYALASLIRELGGEGIAHFLLYAFGGVRTVAGIRNYTQDFSQVRNLR